MKDNDAKKEDLAMRAQKEAETRPEVRSLLLELAQALNPKSASICRHCQGVIRKADGQQGYVANWFHIKDGLRLCSTTEAEPSER